MSISMHDMAFAYIIGYGLALLLLVYGHHCWKIAARDIVEITNELHVHMLDDSKRKLLVESHGIVQAAYETSTGSDRDDLCLIMVKLDLMIKRIDKSIQKTYQYWIERTNEDFLGCSTVSSVLVCEHVRMLYYPGMYYRILCGSANRIRLPVPNGFRSRRRVLQTLDAVINSAYLAEAEDIQIIIDRANTLGIFDLPINQLEK